MDVEVDDVVVEEVFLRPKKQRRKKISLGNDRKMGTPKHDDDGGQKISMFTIQIVFYFLSVQCCQRADRKSVSCY